MATIMDSETLKQSPASPEDIRQASERLGHFWIGAFSPLWVPFFAATSFGLGGWALARALARTGPQDREAYGDLPRRFTNALTAQYGWLKSSEASASLIEEAAGAVNDATGTQTRRMIETQDAVVDAVLTDDLLQSPAIDDLNRRIETTRAVKADAAKKKASRSKRPADK